MESLKYIENTDSEVIYITQKEDTLKSLSVKFKTTINLIIANNNLKEPIIEGQCLYIKKYNEIYTVKITDTLDEISKKCNISIDELKSLNKIDYIYPGQNLVIR